MNIKCQDWKDLCFKDEIINIYLENLGKIGKLAKLNGLQFIKKIYLDSTSFEESKLLTTSFKLKRY